MTGRTRQSEDSLPLLAFFSRRSSGPARRMESLLAHFTRKERDRLRVVLVDVDERPDVAKRLQVRVIPTLVLLQERRVVARLEGRVSAPRIEAMLDAHLRPRSEPAPGVAAPALG